MFQVPHEESGLQFGGELLLGNNGQFDSSVRLVINNLFGIIGGVFHKNDALEACIERFQLQIRKDLTRKLRPIEYPQIGTMFWKISRLSLRLHDTENTGLLSSPFYSSENGYKMCLRLDFYQASRDDAVLSLSLLIVEGENDHSLVWPFAPVVTFGLLNFGTSDGIYTSLRPKHPVMRCYSDDRGTVVARYSWPSKRNKEFVKDDCIFIRCTVSE